MIFRQIEEIKSGRKTQTRRVSKSYEKPVWNGDVIERVAIRGKTTKWRVGNIYAISPKRAAAGVGFIRLMLIRRQFLHSINEADAQAEGVVDRAAYRALWESINGPGSWDQNPSVWVLTFEYVDEVRP